MRSIEEQLREAIALLNRRSYSEAADTLQATLRETPGNPDALQLHGLALKHLGRFEEARQAMDASLAANPRQPHVLNNLGGVHLSLGQFETARNCFDTALGLHPNYKEAWRNLAISLQRLGDLDAAEDAARRALKIDAAFAPALMTLGQILHERGAFDEAVVQLEQAKTLSPDSDEAWRSLGAAYRSAGEFSDALVALDQALKLNPNKSETHAIIGAVRQAMGQTDTAKQAFRSAVALAPGYEAAHFALNQLLWTTGDTDAFLQSYIDATAALPEVADVRCGHANMLMLIDRYDDAEKVLRVAATIAPNHPRVVAMLGNALSKLGLHQEAVSLLARAAQANAPTPRAKIDYARGLLRAGDPQQALAQLNLCDPDACHRSETDQEVLALMYVCARQMGDSLAGELYDYDRFVHAFELPTPKGFSSLAEFNAALAERLAALHTTKQAPLEQTLRGGTQTYGRLFNSADPLIQALRGSIAAVVGAYLERLPHLGAHPMQRWRPADCRFAGSWSVRLQDGGFHKNHLHSRGWLSSAYYVSLPDVMQEPGAARAGWLKFGQPHDLPGAEDEPEHWVQPHEGQLALFPSYMWHGTEQFFSPEPRLTVAFDVQSAAPTPGQLGRF